MSEKWSIFCEESGDKAIPWKMGSSNYYVVTAVLVRECDQQALIDTIDSLKKKVLRIREPLEWKKLDTNKKRNDAILAKFFKRLEAEGPEFMITTVVCNKHETTGSGLQNPQLFMNYLYGLMFQRISWFLKSTNAIANLIIDRNTDNITQDSLRKYLSDIAISRTGEHRRFSKPKWTNPEEHSVLGLADFISGVSLRALSDYYTNVHSSCKVCQNELCIYECDSSNFMYKKSYQYLINWNYKTLYNWDWAGLLYHPFEFKDKYKHIFIPR